VFPIYLALAKQLEFEIPFPQAQQHLSEIAELESSAKCTSGWILWTSA